MPGCHGQPKKKKIKKIFTPQCRLPQCRQRAEYPASLRVSRALDLPRQPVSFSVSYVSHPDLRVEKPKGHADLAESKKTERFRTFLTAVPLCLRSWGHRGSLPAFLVPAGFPPGVTLDIVPHGRK